MERAACIGKLNIASPFGTFTKFSEIFGGLWNNISIETHNDPTSIITSDRNVKIHLRGNLSLRFAFKLSEEIL